MKKEVLADRYLKMFKSIALGVILSTAGTSAVFAADRPADAVMFACRYRYWCGALFIL